MKFLLLLAFSPIPALAASIEVIGACSATPAFSSSQAINAGESLGAFTLRAFSEGKLEFVGSERGINSIQGSPTGMEALEIISREEMRSYGWCFSLNGETTMKYADEIPLQSDRDSVKWFFGYAHYLRGEWLSMCNPVWQLKPDFICKR